MQKIPDFLKVVVFVAIGMVLSSFYNPIFVFGGVAAFCAGMILLGSPVWLLMFLLFWSLTAILIDMAFNSTLLRRVDDLQILLMIAVFMGKIALRKMPHAPLFRSFLVLLGLILFSAVINQSEIKGVALFLLAYVAPYFLFYLVYTVRHPKLPEKVIKLVLFVYGIGLLMNLGWFLQINPIYNEHLGKVDFAKGTLGVCSVWAYFTIFVFFMTISLFRGTKQYSKRVGYMIFIGILLLQFYMTYTNHAYFIFAAVVPVYAVITNQRLRGYLVMLVFIAIVSVLLVSVGTSDKAARMRGTQGFILSDTQYLKQRWSDFLQEPKADLYNKVVWRGMRDGVLEWFVGHGPGAGTSTVARADPSPYTMMLVGDYYLTHSGMESMRGQSISQSPWSGVVELWSEVGAIGVVLFYGMPLSIMWIVFKRLRRKYYAKGSMELIVAESFMMYGTLFFIINFISGYWSVDALTFLLWVLAAVAMRWPLSTSEAIQHSVEEPTSTAGESL